MNILRIATIVLLLIPLACAGEQEGLTGTWTYDILVNGENIGISRTTIESKGNTWVITTTMDVETGTVSNSVWHRIIEEKGTFRPVEISLKNVIRQGDMEETVKTRATFHGQKVELHEDGKKRTVTLEEDFHLDGNYLLDHIRKEGLTPGTVYSTRIYDPSLEPDTTIPVRVEVKGTKTMNFRGEEKQLFHVTQKIKNLKYIDMYMDSRGLLYRAEIVMLNNRLELVLKDGE
jgi:hypothetical protein